MATLTAEVSAEQTSWNVSALPNVDYLQADDEIVRVLNQKRTENRIQVQRAYAGTTAATHAADIELTPVYVPSAGGGGGLSEEDHDALSHGLLTSANGEAQVNTSDVIGVKLNHDGDNTVVQLSGNSGLLITAAIVVIDELPTVNPNNTGQLWNDGGTVKVSA